MEAKKIAQERSPTTRSGQDLHCPTCSGSGGTALNQCGACEGTGCQHVVKPKQGHCSVCEQDDNCLACRQRAPMSKPDPGETEVFEPPAPEA